MSMNPKLLSVWIVCFAFTPLQVSVLSQEAAPTAEEGLKPTSATHYAAVRYFEIAKNKVLPESSRVIAIQKLSAPTIPSTTLIDGEAMHHSLTNLLNTENESYEIRYQTAKAIFARYSGQNKKGNEAQQSHVIQGISNCAKNPKTEERLRNYLLKRMVDLTWSEKPKAP